MPTLNQHPDTIARHKMWSRQTRASETVAESRTRSSDPQENLVEEVLEDASQDGGFLQDQPRPKKK